MRRLTAVWIGTNGRVAIGGLIVVIAVLAMMPLRTGIVQAQSNACVTGGAVSASNAGLAQDCETLLGLMDTCVEAPRSTGRQADRLISGMASGLVGHLIA